MHRAALLRFRHGAWLLGPRVALEEGFGFGTTVGVGVVPIVVLGFCTYELGVCRLRRRGLAIGGRGLYRSVAVGVLASVRFRGGGTLGIFGAPSARATLFENMRKMGLDVGDGSYAYAAAEGERIGLR